MTGIKWRGLVRSDDRIQRPVQQNPDQEVTAAEDANSLEPLRT